MLHSYDIDSRLEEARVRFNKACIIIEDFTEDGKSKFKELIIDAHSDLDICTEFLDDDFINSRRNFILNNTKNDREKEILVLEKRIEIIRKRMNSLRAPKLSKKKKKAKKEARINP